MLDDTPPSSSNPSSSASPPSTLGPASQPSSLSSASAQPHAPQVVPSSLKPPPSSSLPVPPAAGSKRKFEEDVHQTVQPSKTARLDGDGTNNLLNYLSTFSSSPENKTSLDASIQLSLLCGKTQREVIVSGMECVLC